MLSRTPEQRHFMFTTKCPRCERMLLTGPRYFRPDGTGIPMFAINSITAAEAIAQCPKCKQTWQVYETGTAGATPGQPPQAYAPQAPSAADAVAQGLVGVPGVGPQGSPGHGSPGLGQAAQGLPAQGLPAQGHAGQGFAGQAQPPGPVSPILPSIGVRTVDLVETRRVEEPIGEERRTIDNSGPATSTRRIKVTKRWLRRYEMSVEQVQSRKFGGGLPKALIVELSAEAEKRLQRSYSASDEEEQTFEEELELTVPPRSVVTLVLSWKRIWQEGVIAVTQPDADRIEVPFRVVVGVTFDQAST